MSISICERRRRTAIADYRNLVDRSYRARTFDRSKPEDVVRGRAHQRDHNQCERSGRRTISEPLDQLSGDERTERSAERIGRGVESADYGHCGVVGWQVLSGLLDAVVKRDNKQNGHTCGGLD